MTPKPTRNTAASVRQRLLNHARRHGDDFQLLLTRYCIERLLYRLSRSVHADKFVLKGAMLFFTWGGSAYRPTRDLDLLGRSGSSPSHLEDVFKGVCAVQVEDDGLEFDATSVRAGDIRETQEYGGVRVQLNVRLAQARLDLQVDVGFGDALVPQPRKVEFSSLLGFPRARIYAYRRETVVAEKYQAMVALGIVNSRMKDFYDLWVLANDFEFEGELLCRSLKATFKRRTTAIPVDVPLALTDEFCTDATKQAQWRAFIRKNSLEVDGRDLDDVIRLLNRFLMPPTQAAASSASFERHWPAGGPWG